ncbi:MAG: hypothetical protein DRJ42_04955 [Deltaproteobacteria bacterium]|nr:MAG: hypothetical protein DRJ42_04955 [Deltaproteobacteria bacterium]
METELTRDPGDLFALDANAGPFRNRKEVYEADLAALLSHRTASYPGRVALLQATERPKYGLREDAYGWRAFARDVETHDIPGAHRDLMTRSHVHRVAEILRRAMMGSAVGRR